METLANLESFRLAAEAGGFSAAARRLGLTPAAVSRNVAMLERNLGQRLFQRSTRRLTLTEAGERFLQGIVAPLEGLQAAIADASSGEAEPSGTLKVSVSLGFGIEHILPLLPGFLRRYPRIRPDWSFENRQVDLIAEGFDAAIGGGFELSPGLIARNLAPAHIIAVAAPAYLEGRPDVTDPSGLASLDGIVMRPPSSGRIRQWVMRDAAGEEVAALMDERTMLSDAAALCRAAVLGLGVALVAVPDALPHLESGTLRRVLPGWYADAGAISLYYAHRTLMPAKTRAFVDFVSEAFRERRLAERFAGSLGIVTSPPT
jgi:DNA-binding transcriptional LysR family regulator